MECPVTYLSLQARRMAKQRSAPATVYAALDLGTNNCRLLMARPWGAAFRVVEAYSKATRLGEGLAESGRLSEAAMSRTIEVLKTCAERMQRAGVSRARHVATEACRRAANCDDFIARVEDEAGFRLDIISAKEEADLALAGCAPLLDPAVSRALVFDIGGGSTELVWVGLGDEGAVDGFCSLPVGVVTVAEQYAPQLAEADGYRAVVDWISRMLEPFEASHGITRHISANQAQMLGTSGTVTTLAGIHLDLKRYDRAAVDGLMLDFSSIDAVSRRLGGMSHDARSAHPCIGRDRADLVIAGCAILEAICRIWPFGRLRVADRGVREGVLLGMMRADASSALPAKAAR